MEPVSNKSIYSYLLISFLEPVKPSILAVNFPLSLWCLGGMPQLGLRKESFEMLLLVLVWDGGGLWGGGYNVFCLPPLRSLAPS